MNSLIKKAILRMCILLPCAVISQNVINPSWVHFADESNSDYVTDLWVAPGGESYTIGHIGSVGDNPDGLMLLKVNALGQEIWRRKIYPATDEWGLMAKSIIADEHGDIFVAYNERFKYTHFTNNRVVVNKYNTQGELLWSTYYTAHENGPIEEVATHAAACKNGILYLAGTSTHLDPSANLNGMIVKINLGTGELMQKIVFNSQYNSDDIFRQIKVDDTGNMWAVGRSRGYMWPGGIYSDYDANVVKYNADGQLQWEHRENGTSNNIDFGINIAIDDEGNCYTSNQVKSLSISQSKVLVQKISALGAILWTYEYQGSSSGYNWDQPVSLLPNGNVALVFSNEDGINTMCLDGFDGTQVWTANYNRNSMGMANHQRNMVVDALGNIYITGTSRDNTPMGGGYDLVTLKYNSQGTLEWLSNFNHANYDTAGDDGVRLMLDSMGNVYAIGWTSGDNFNDDFLLLKYGDAVMGTEDIEEASVLVYPNPVSDFINIVVPESIIPDEITLADMNGKIMLYMNKFSNQRGVISFDMQGLSTGIYLMTIQSQKETIVFKVIKN